MDSRSLALGANIELSAASGRRETARLQTVSLFRDLREPLGRYLASLGVNQPEIEEMVQEAFLRVYRHLCSRDEADQNLAGWVFRVAHNLVRDRRRGWHGRKVDSLNDRPEAALASAAEATPEQRVLDLEKMKLVRSALATLPAVERQCLHLRAEGMRYREIAEALGVGTTTVADMIRHALAQIGKARDND